MENKHKHLDYIQSAISKMGSNSFYLKGWNITIIAAIITLSFKESDWRIYVCAICFNFLFWFLDSYYLMQEKLLRELYKKVSLISNDIEIDFSMDIKEFKKDIPSICCIMFKNISITPLYLFNCIILIILILIICRSY